MKTVYRAVALILALTRFAWASPAVVGVSRPSLDPNKIQEIIRAQAKKDGAKAVEFGI